jgi:hypothetical protein
MGEKVVRTADLTGEIVANPDELIGLMVTDYPDLDEPRRIEVTPPQLEQIGKLSIAAVGLEVESTGEDEKPIRYRVPLDKFVKLATNRPMDEVLAEAQLAVPTTPKRRSHNTTTNGEPLINYNDPEFAGLPHKGKIGEREAEFVRSNLALVNERRATAGQSPIDPMNPTHAKRYGFETETPRTTET